jgi:hypothetical protein
MKLYKEASAAVAVPIPRPNLIGEYRMVSPGLGTITPEAPATIAKVLISG